MESRAQLFKVMERHLGGGMGKEKGNEALAYEETHPMADCIKLYESLPHPHPPHPSAKTSLETHFSMIHGKLDTF